MSSPISAINAPLPIQPIELNQTASTAGAAGGGSFQSFFHTAIAQVESTNATADDAVQGFLTGQNQELHSVILATQKADLQFDMFMQVRNKVVSAYQEIMKMQI